MKQTLYELTSEFLSLLEAEEIDTKEVEGSVTDIKTKLDGYAKVRAELRYDAKNLRSEEKRLAGRRKQIESNVERLESAMTDALEVLDAPNVNTGTFTIRLQSNPPSLVESEDADPPDDYLIPQPPKVDRAGIKDAIKAGGHIEGYEVVSVGKSLRIK
jgi:chromosome segregation ATPase